MENPTFHLEGVVKSRDDVQDFEGPLSLILMLLSKNKIEIRDISISDILDQYLAYLDEMQRMDLEVASEFVQMAAYLLYIKTRTLLAAEEEVTELEQLMSSLEQLKAKDAHEAVKTVLPALSELSAQGMLLWTRPQEPVAPAAKVYDYRHEGADLLRALYTVFSRSDAKLPGPPELRALAATEAELAAADELEDTVRVLASFGCVGGVNIDLSITCDTEYYNGLVFKGYVPGAPSAVLSGGRYDSLMRKLGKDEQAIGFAVYLNLLERLGGAEPEYDADVLLIPDGETPEELAGMVRELTDSGRSVRVQSGAAPSLRCRTVMKMMDGRPVELEGDD